MKIDHLLLYVSNLDSTASFYQALGFEIAERGGMYIVVRLGNFELHCHDQSRVHFKQDVERLKGAGVFIYILTEDADAKYSELKNLGLRPSSEPTDWEWGNREFAIKDPDGYKLIFYYPINL